MSAAVRAIAVTATVLLLSACGGYSDGPAVVTSTPTGSSPAVPASTSAPQASTSATTEVREPTADWANATLPIGCNGADEAEFADGEAITEVDGMQLYSFVGQPEVAEVLGGVYALVPTFCTAGAGSVGAATLYRVSADGSQWENIRVMTAPDQNRTSTFDAWGFEDGMAYVDWLGYSDDTQPDYRPDLHVNAVYPLDPTEDGWVIGTERIRSKLKEPATITVTPLYVVPDVIGLNRRQVWMATARYPLTFWGTAPAGVSVNDTIANLDTCPVTWQSPAAGSKVKRGTRVTLRYC